MIKSSILVDIDYFDDNTFLYCEERILSYKLQKHGYKVVFQPLAEVIHEHSGTIERDSPFADLEFLKSHIYALRKYENYGPIKVFVMKLLYGSRYILKSIFSNKYRKNTRELFLVLRK